MSEPFIGQIALFPYTFAPRDWAECAGQLFPVRQYAALFSLLGVSFGGNGQTSFGLPDLQGRGAIGQGAMPSGSDYAIGDTAGQETVQLTTIETPLHTHPLNATTAKGTTNAPSGNVLAAVLGNAGKGGGPGKANGNIYNAGSPNVTLAPQSVGIAGGGQAHGNMQPSLTLRYCISLSGIFPNRP